MDHGRTSRPTNKGGYSKYSLGYTRGLTCINYTHYIGQKTLYSPGLGGDGFETFGTKWFLKLKQSSYRFEYRYRFARVLIYCIIAFILGKDVITKDLLLVCNGSFDCSIVTACQRHLDYLIQ